MQHVLPAYFQKSRRYGLHASAIKKKYIGKIPEAVKRNGHTIRTVMQIITQLIKETPFVCEKCESKEYEIIIIKPNKEWIQRYITVPTPRPPPFKMSYITNPLKK